VLVREGIGLCRYIRERGDRSLWIHDTHCVVLFSVSVFCVVLIGLCRHMIHM